MKRRTFLIIGLLLFFYMVHEIGFETIYEEIKSITPTEFLILMTLSFFGWILQTFRWYIILGTYGMKLSLVDLFFARLGGHAIGYLTPTAFLGGIPIRTFMTRHPNKRECAASIIIDKAVQFSSVAFLIVVATIIALPMTSLPEEAKIFFILLSIGAIIFSLFLFIRQKKGLLMGILNWLKAAGIRINFLEKNRKKIKEIDFYVSGFYRNNKKTSIFVFILNCVSYLYLAAEIFVTLLFLGVGGASFLDAFIIVVFATAATVVPIPATLGVAETTNVVVFVLLGLGASVGLAVTIIRRVVDLLWTVAGLLIISERGF